MAGDVVEAGLGDPRAQSQMGQQPEARRHPLHVGLDFGRASKAACPAGVGREGKRIGRRRHIDVRAGVGVVPPGAAQAVLLFQDHEVMGTGALELDRSAQPRHARAEDHHLVVGCLRRGGGRGQWRHHEARNALDGLVGTAQHAAVGLEHMPAPGGDLAARLDPGRLQGRVELQRLAVQQLVGAGLDQRGRQAVQVGEQR